MADNVIHAPVSLATEDFCLALGLRDNGNSILLCQRDDFSVLRLTFALAGVTRVALYRRRLRLHLLRRRFGGLTGGGDSASDFCFGLPYLVQR
jgi:hypothetical protein